MSGEIWRDVPSVPGILVSSDGRVMHTPYRGLMPNGGNRAYGGEPHFGVWNKADARFQVGVHGTIYKVARLVAEGFHGPAPHLDAVVMHLDENSANNRPENLKWGTQKENMNADGYLAYCRSRIGDASPAIKGRKA